MKAVVHVGHLFIYCFSIFLLSSCKQYAIPPNLAWSAYKQDITSEARLIYTLTQPAGVPMLIKAWGYEVEFELTTSDFANQISQSTRTPYIRLGPQFQVLEEREVDTEIHLTLTPINLTKNSHISVEAFQLSKADQASKKQIEAYRLVSDALEYTASDKKEIWQAKVSSLKKANHIFKSLGQNENYMWVESYENYFTYFPLNQFDQAIINSKNLEIEASQHGLIEIELLALEIQGQALIERDSTDTEEAARKKLSSAQLIFDRALKIAGNRGLEFERAWIINEKGVGYFYAGNPEESLKACIQAKSITAELEDNFLLSLIEENTVNAYVDFGNLTGAIETLRRIGELEKVENNLARATRHQVEIAKLHSLLYEFPQAIEGLSSALAFFEASGDQESLGRAQLSLASAYFEIGNTARAIDYLGLSLSTFESANYGRGLYDANRVLADIYRQLGKFKRMHQYRDEQTKYLATDFERTSVIFESAKDLYKQKRFIDAKHLFGEGFKHASVTKHENLRVISELYLCLIEYELGNSDNRCSASSQSFLQDEVRSIVNTRRKIEGMFLWAQIQQQANYHNEAFTALDELVNEVRFHRKNLPGVLGAWFWEYNNQLFEEYLKVSVDMHQSSAKGAFESLKNIQKIKNITFYTDRHDTDGKTNNGDIQAARAMRTLIASMEAEDSRLSKVELGTQLDNLMLKTSVHGAQPGNENENRWLGDALAELPDDSAVLTIYLFDDLAYIWVANNQEVILRKLSQDFDVSSMLRKVLTDIRHQGNDTIQPLLESLGQSLLQPVMAYLPETIYFLPLGEFNGFPLEALKVDNEYLIEQHQVVNIESLESIRSWSNKQDFKIATNKFFVASNQYFNDPAMVDLPGVALELANIVEIFNESEVSYSQDENLTIGTFSDANIKEADVIHIASHTVLNVDYPELSRIYLNPHFVGQDGANTNFLVPADIRSQSYGADLVVLSACQTTGLNNFTFSSNLGFVSELLSSGPRMVVASLWPVADSDTVSLMKEFYASLRQDSNVISALTNLKRTYIKTSASNRVEVWASFQLFM